MGNKFCQFITLFFNHLNAFFSNFWSFKKVLSDFFDKFHLSRLFFFSNQCSIVNQVQNLMEKAFRSSNWNFSSDLNVNWVICFSGQSWSLNIDDTNCFDVLLVSAILYNVNQIFSFSWLTDHNYCLILSNIFRFKINWIVDVNLLEAFQMLKMPYWRHSCIITWSTRNHREVITKIDLIKFFEIRMKVNFSLLSNFILIKSFIWFWRLFKYLSVVINHHKSSFFS